jgi:hypothetical protein
VLEKSPHRDVQGQACLRLALFLSGRLNRLDLLKDQPDVARRYEGLNGQDHLDALRRQDRAKAIAEIEAIFEQAAEKCGDVKLPFGGTVATTPGRSCSRFATSRSARRRPTSRARTSSAWQRLSHGRIVIPLTSSRICRTRRTVSPQVSWCPPNGERPSPTSRLNEPWI